MAFFGKNFSRDELGDLHDELPKETPLEFHVVKTPVNKQEVVESLKQWTEVSFIEELVHTNSSVLDEAEAIIYEKQIEDESSSSW